MQNLTYLLFLFFLIPGLKKDSAETKILWQIGIENNKAAEFALKPDNYQDFLKKDFGWEDRYYLIGVSKPEKDWPYIIPGPQDKWGGTGGTSGIRTNVMNILFAMDTLPKQGKYKLIVTVLETSEKLESLLKITVNSKSWKYKLKPGTGDISLKKEPNTQNSQTVSIDLDPGIITTHGNEIQVGIIEGSWLIFDEIRLEGPATASISKTHQAAFIRKVKPADYELKNKTIQPLLIDVEHLNGTPELTVKLDNNLIFKQKIEQGRYLFEVPMPAVLSAQKSNYSIALDGRIIENATIVRTPQIEASAADYVDTQIGTAHSRWMIAPGPWMPFSMVKLSPDNQNTGWQSGYDPSFESIGTFSHIHEWTMAGLGMMPTSGQLKTDIGDQSVDTINPLSPNNNNLKPPLSGYRSRIDKASEKTPIGYYSVKLTDYDILAELTATNRCGFQRYTYPKEANARVMIDLQIPSEYKYLIQDAEIRQINSRRIEGFSKQLSADAWSGGVDQEYTIYFVIEFDHDINKFGGWENELVSENRRIKGTNLSKIGAYAEFDTRKNQIIQTRSAISYVDIEGARLNLKTEISDPFKWNFEKIRQAQVDSWNEILNRVEISSNDKREKTRFYTNLYRSYCRNTYSDSDGRWVDASEKIQKFSSNDALALGCDAFWNTFWNLNQVWNLITPEWSSRWVKSQLAMFDANGWLAKGPAGMEYIPVMVAEHEIPLLVGAYQMGIRDYDTDKLFTAVKKMQTTLPQKIGGGFAGNGDLEPYLKYGYVPSDKGRFSNSLEYSFDDWTVGQLALALGKKQDYEVFNDRGNWWRNVIEPKSGYAQLRNSEGIWQSDFDPFKSGANHHYVEGNAWQLTFFVPQNIPALANAIGKNRFIERLNWGFEQSEPWRYNAPGDQYWDFPVVQGNQQSMHFAFLFNWVDQPWKTQKWSRSILDRYYGFDISNAYLGDEDQGQMSAWFIMAALGLFQTDGGTRLNPIYEIGSPLFEKVTIDLGQKYGRGQKFIIEAKETSRKNIYVQSANLNGKVLNSFQFPANELLKGGKLSLIMGPKPNKKWGTQ